MPLESLPILDLSTLDDGPDAAEEFRAVLLAATHDVGFFYLTGHGLTDDDIATAFATAEKFFALPLEDKVRLEMVNSPHFRGYNRTGGELTQGRVDWREQIDIAAERDAVTDPAAPAYMRLEGPNQWPGGLPELRETFTVWEQRCAAIGSRLLREWALALGSPADVFAAAFTDRPSTLIKLVRYPGRRDDDRAAQGVGAHKDPGVLTLLTIGACASTSTIPWTTPRRLPNPSAVCSSSSPASIPTPRPCRRCWWASGVRAPSCWSTFPASTPRWALGRRPSAACWRTPSANRCWWSRSRA